MKTDQKPVNKKNKVSVGEVALTTIMFGWIAAALLGGGYMLNIVKLPAGSVKYIGAALVAYVFVGFIAITLLCAKFMLNKKG